ncbi:hypothetical protein [Qipengyuania mesophila]|uniref:Uncharacterized protein n=1 Tax=Qipengyuania mesophila TaxID=2867246 RepID=A0ABS7JTK4_9SPHN|nr:hypothetical protein [Qipengyuania mesophila]MBX7500990.1 hypothetical protein [Qipengyuania mesophila]
MTIHRLDVDVAIYRDRVQVTHRATRAFADQPAKFAFSSDTSIVSDPRCLEDTIVRAIRKVLAEGAFEMREPIAHVVSCETPLDEKERAIVEAALFEAGMRKVVFDFD